MRRLGGFLSLLTFVTCASFAGARVATADQPSLSVNDVTANEGNSGTTPFVFTVTLSSASSQTVTVYYHTIDGMSSAHAPSDYTATSGTLTFAPGETSKTIPVQVVGDTVPEGDEYFEVGLGQVQNAVVNDGVGDGWILNDDVNFSIADVKSSETNSGTVSWILRVQMDGAIRSPATVNFTTSDGTATAYSDYEPNKGTITYKPGDQANDGFFDINVYGDTTPEPDETFYITLTNPTNATISRGKATMTILNDDGTPTGTERPAPTHSPTPSGAPIQKVNLTGGSVPPSVKAANPSRTPQGSVQPAPSVGSRSTAATSGARGAIAASPSTGQTALAADQQSAAAHRHRWHWLFALLAAVAVAAAATASLVLSRRTAARNRPL
jgi:hypothetical protein